MAMTTVKVAATSRGGMALGRIVRNMIRRSLQPIARAAFTYSISRNRRNSARARRAASGHSVRPMARVSFRVPGSSMKMTTIEKRRPGITWKISVKRMSRASTHPPKYPARLPTKMPMVIVMAAATAATTRVARPPPMIPARMSRPR